MEDTQPSKSSSVYDFYQKCLRTKWVVFFFLLMLLGINLALLGAYFHNEMPKAEYAIMLAGGVLMAGTAFGVLSTKLLDHLRGLYAPEVSEFKEFTNEEGHLGSNLVLNSDLGLNDQHLPSGVLRLQEES